MNKNIILTCAGLSCSIETLTKNSNTPSHASKLAFFVPKINQAWLGLQRFSAKYRNHISRYERVKARIKDLAIGNKCNRVTAISDTRSPELKQVGLLTRNSNGGQTMPVITSNRLTAFTFSVNLPDDSFIKTVSAMYSAGDWLAYITTTRDQHAPICNTQGKPLRFATLDSLAHYLADAGLCEFDVSLLGLKGAA